MRKLSAVLMVLVARTTHAQESPPQLPPPAPATAPVSATAPASAPTQADAVPSPIPAPGASAQASGTGASAQVVAPAIAAPVEPTEAPEPPKPRSGFFFAQGGGAMRHVAGSTIYAGDLRIGGGGGRNVPIYGFGGLTWGATTTHLRAYTVNAGVGFDAKLDPLPLRVGIGGELQYLVIRRASVDGNFNTLGLGAFAQATLDVVRFDEAGSGAFTITARINASFFNESFLWGPTVLAGVRF